MTGCPGHGPVTRPAPSSRQKSWLCIWSVVTSAMTNAFDVGTRRPAQLLGRVAGSGASSRSRRCGGRGPGGEHLTQVPLRMMTSHQSVSQAMPEMGWWAGHLCKNDVA